MAAQMVRLAAVLPVAQAASADLLATTCRQVAGFWVAHMQLAASLAVRAALVALRQVVMPLAALLQISLRLAHFNLKTALLLVVLAESAVAAVAAATV
jgi:hypothetical protein